MFNKEECIAITCDNCGEIHTGYHSGFSFFCDENAAHESADNEGWYSNEDIHYCPDCHSFDDDDVLVLKKVSPIYLVIADFPENKDFPKGKKISFTEWNSDYWQYSVSDCQGERTWLSSWFEQYPHIFRRISGGGSQSKTPTP